MRKIEIPLCIAAILIAVLVVFWPFLERQDCICAILTTEDMEFTIDDRLKNFYEGIDDLSGVLVSTRGTCRHGTRVVLTIYPDKEVYSGKVVE